MNPSYRIQIDVCLAKPMEKDNIWLRHVKTLPFVPRVDDTLILTSDDEEETLDISYDTLKYDCAAGTFVAAFTDETLVENYSTDGVCRDKDSVTMYEGFGFVRLNYPQGQVIRE